MRRAVDAWPSGPLGGQHGPFLGCPLVVEQALSRRGNGYLINISPAGHEAALYQAVHDQVEIRFGTQIQTVTQHATGVRAALTDATMVEADLLVGADGLHSGVRALAFGSQQRFRVALDNILVAAFLPQRPPAAWVSTPPPC